MKNEQLFFPLFFIFTQMACIERDLPGGFFVVLSARSFFTGKDPILDNYLRRQQ
jgi:hypothetical protein